VVLSGGGEGLTGGVEGFAGSSICVEVDMNRFCMLLTSIDVWRFDGWISLSCCEKLKFQNWSVRSYSSSYHRVRVKLGATERS
jgi:hypothetical protein